MDWRNERWVKVYVRDTADFLALSWDGQALLLQLIRKVNRCGALALGRRGPRALASLLGQTALWESRIKPALDELLEDGCVFLDGEQLVLKNFVAAQQATASGASRTAKWREQKRAACASAAVSAATGDETSPPADDPSPPGDAVTGSGDGARRAVTKRHQEGRTSVEITAQPTSGDETSPPADVSYSGGDAVTSQRDDARRAVTNRVEEILDLEISSSRRSRSRLVNTNKTTNGTSAFAEAPEPPLLVSPGATPSPAPEKPSRTQAAERQVFEHWRRARGKRADVLFSPQRRAKIRARLAEGFSAERLCQAIDGVANDPWDERPQHDDLDQILRDAGQVEKFLTLAERGPPRHGGPRPAAGDPQAAQRADARARAEREAERTARLIAQYQPPQLPQPPPNPEARP